MARVKLGFQDRLHLGNLDARRDWGHARDYVEAMWLMLQQEGPDDYVIASGEQHSVREFVEQAFRVAGIEIEWRGSGPTEVAVAVGGTISGQPAKGRALVRIDPRYLRPTEVDTLLGDASKAKARLGWIPRVGFEALVAEMVQADLREAERDHLVKSSGYPVYAPHE